MRTLTIALCLLATPALADVAGVATVIDGDTIEVTGALLDRLTHHVHILEMNADSYRLNQSRRKRKFP